MEERRPYWKVIVSLVFSLIGTALFIFAGTKLLVYFMPFAIGWVIALIAHPMVCWLEKRLKIVKKLGSAIIVILVIGAIVGLIYLGISKIWTETGRLIKDFPKMYSDLEIGLTHIGQQLEGIFKRLPEGVQNGFQAIILNLDQTMGELISRVSEPTVSAAGNIVKKLPSIFVGIIVTVVSAYFFTIQREEVIVWCKKTAPAPIQKRMEMVVRNFKSAVGGYFKAQFKIMIVVCALLLVGLNILGVNYTILLSILIGMLDFLPFFGTGTVMLPWAVYKLLVGNYKLAIGLLIVYATTQIVRQLIQPKLVGDSVGLNPLITLILLYVGYKAGSLIGLIISVPIGIIVINMYKAGAFEYITDDVKILIEGILSLRE